MTDKEFKKGYSSDKLEIHLRVVPVVDVYWPRRENSLHSHIRLDHDVLMSTVRCVVDSVTSEVVTLDSSADTAQDIDNAQVFCLV